MDGSTVDQILRDSELKNEWTLALGRGIIFLLIVILDFLSYFQSIVYTMNPPTPITLILDSTFFLFSLLIIFILLRKTYYWWLKFFTITVDYLLISAIIILDPTVPKDGEIIHWIILLAILFIFLLNLLRHSVVAIVYAGILSMLSFQTVSYFLTRQFVEDLVPMTISLSLMLVIGFYVTRSNKKMMVEANTKKMMERYLSPQLVGELYQNDTSLEPGGAIKEVTTVFSDIRSFTSISEKMNPGEVVGLLNDYLTTMTDIIFQHNGTIDKFIGDAIMTIFGAPRESEDDLFRAVNTAVEMNRVMVQFSRKYPSLENSLQIGIGIHTGPVIAGNIGSDKRFDYTVIGDNVNLASRVESLTKYYRCPILMTESFC